MAKLTLAIQKRTNALADFALVPFASAGMVGGVGVGELVSVGAEADVDELGSGVGSGFDSQPATAAAQASPAMKAVKRPARV